MCFSATGSFIAAGINAAAGAAVLPKVEGGPESILAGFPLLFAVQQAIEGAIWLTLPGGAHLALDASLADAFVFVALVVWPSLAPLAALSLEGHGTRRALMGCLLVAGLIFSAFYLGEMVRHPYAAHIAGHSIAYSNGRTFPLWAGALYCLCTCAPLLLSTVRTLRLLGIAVLVGLIVSAGFFYFTLFSVWCSFAALASGLIFFRAYFELPRLARASARAR
ncbi:MAG: DUF6629 family protein [Rhizomicrobium sp.]